MAANSDRLMRLSDLATAAALLTRLPMRLGAADFQRSAAASWAWPLVGALVGALGGAAALALSGLGAFVQAVAALAVMVLATGAMHEDGLADVADGFWGGFERARRLEIMRDSHIGAYGVLALVLSVLLKLALFVELGADMIAGMIAAATLGRAGMVALMAALPEARSDGLSHRTGRPSWQAATLAGALALVLCLCLTGAAGLFGALLAVLALFGFAQVAQRKIGGQTGDVLGAGGQLAEIAALLGLALCA